MCRETSITEDIAPVCIAGGCPVGFDILPPAALRIMEIRGMLAGLADHHLAGRVCEEYGADLDDLKWLAEIDALLKELQPRKTI